MNTSSFSIDAKLVAEGGAAIERIAQALGQRGLAPVLQEGVISRSPEGNVWLVAELDTGGQPGPGRRFEYEQYTSRETLHQISTLLSGKPVFLSNTTGIRYLVLLSGRPTLPKSVAFPDELPGRDRFPFGVSVYGPLSPAPQQFVNVIVSGVQGAGKSNFLEGLALTGRAYGYALYLADPDGNTFNPDVWNTQAVAPVAQSDREFVEVLEKLQAELARRRALFQAAAKGAAAPANLDEYNARRGDLPHLPRILLLADEANTFFDQPQALDTLADLARRGRKWGLHLVLAAHNWRAGDVPRRLSAMFPTRLCFRVADDTSGKVVLGSPTWGKKAMRIHLETPGRGILFYNGQYRWFQAYRVEREKQAQLLATITAPEALTEIEKRLVVYAVERMDGQFIINRLTAAFADQGQTHHAINKLARSWELRGWLTKPRHATDARRVTDELRRLAGLERTGEQGVQDRTGTVQGVQDVILR